MDKKYSYSKLIDISINKITSLRFREGKINDLKLFINELNINYMPRIVTITGTNGKGTTAAILSYIFCYNRINHICHTSPHIQSFNERISYNQITIQDHHLLSYLNKIYCICLKLEIMLNYHFIGFIITWLYIQLKKPEWVILEVGIGGRLDPANLFDADIVIITNVSLDHCEILGNTIEEIAIEKACLARRHRPVILGSRIPEGAMQYLRDIDANISYANYSEVIPHALNHPSNVACAIDTMKILVSNPLIPNDLEKYVVPGRFQIIQNQPLVIVDIAHNPQAVENLFSKMKLFLRGLLKRRVLAIFGANKNKDIENMLKYGEKIVDQWLIPDLSALDRRFETIQEQDIRIKFPDNSLFFNDPHASFEYSKANSSYDDIIIVFGSFNLVGEIIKYNFKDVN